MLFEQIQPQEEQFDEPDPLGSVGCSAQFTGSAESFLGLSKNLLKSLSVAFYAESLGINLFREHRATMTKMLGPLPRNEWIACTWPELKHSKHLPSEYLQDSKRMCRELTYYANGRYRAGRQFAMLTFPALDGLSSVSEFGEAHRAAFKKSEFVRKLIEDDGEIQPSVIFERLEGEYRAKKKKVYWHFHVIVEFNSGEDELAALQRLLNENSREIAKIWAGVKLEPIKRFGFSRAAFYCAKPCNLAFQIAQSEHEEDFLALLENSKRRRTTRRWSGFKAFSSKLTKDHVRVAAGRNERGEEVLSLVKKSVSSRKSRKRRCGKTVDQSNVQSCQNASEVDHLNAAESPHDNFEQTTGMALKGDDRKLTSEQVRPEFCGLSGPTPGPGNRLFAKIRVRNFTEAALTTKENSGWWLFVSESQEELLKIWETNTGKDYDLLSVLRPFARVLKRLLKEKGGNVHRPTLTASPGIYQALGEIVQAHQPVRQTQKKKRIHTFSAQFTNGAYEVARTLPPAFLPFVKERLWLNLRKFLRFFWGQAGQYG